MILTQAQADGVALWVMQAQRPNSSSRVHRSAAASRVLEVLSHFVPQPQSAPSIRAATLFRVIEEHRPTLLLDEVDTYLKSDPEDRWSRLALAENLRKLGRLSEAESVLRVLPSTDLEALTDTVPPSGYGRD